MSSEQPSNHVKLMRNLFEATTNSNEKPIVRSATSINLSKSNESPEANNKFRGSIRRSPAFRLETTRNYKPSLAKSSEKILHVNDQEYLQLSSTLKRILRTPLPSEPAPPKPPRTFFSPNRQVFINKDEELKIEATENKSSKLSCISSCQNRSNIYDQVQDEPIYSEPFQNGSFKSLSPENTLHYMVSDIPTEKKDLFFNQCQKSKSASAIQKVQEDQKYEKINLLLDAVFDKENAELESEGGQNNKLIRSLTDRRKKYALQVSQSFKNEKQQYGFLKLTEFEDFKPLTIAERIEHYKKFIDQNGSEKTEHQSAYKETLFISCLLVGMSENKPYVKSAFPKVKSLPFIEHFVYPNSNYKTQNMLQKEDQNHCLILTDDHANRLYGYCRKVIAENSTVALPLTYCLITNKKSSGFYFKEIESRHGQSESQLKFMLSSLYSLPVPKSGRLLHLKLPSAQVRGNLHETSHSQTTSRPIARRLSLDNNPLWLRDSTKKQSAGATNAVFANNDEIFIKRPNDLRFENDEISILYKNTTNKILVAIFGSLLLERKIVLLSNSLYKLSYCVCALESILYPLEWQHTIIAVVPKDLQEITQAPIPVLVGILKTNESFSLSDFEDGLLVDLDLKTIVKSCGDESTLLPENLKKSLMLSFEIVDLLALDWKLSNVLIAEAFLRFFVELFADLNAANYKKEDFLRTTSDRSTQLFLEWFVETSIFHQFLKKKLQHDQLKAKNTEAREESFYDLFNEKVLEKSKNKTSSQHYKKVEALVKNCKMMNRKARTFKDKIKDFFNTD